MASTRVFQPGGYRYIPAVFQYSSGVAAEPGFEIERVRFAKPIPLAEAYSAVERHLAGLGRPTEAFCACELRSPEPFTPQGFKDFNREYVQTLERWGIFKDDDNPVARTNVCPAFGAPAEPSMYAFSYTVPSTSGKRSFIGAGGGETREVNGRFEIVRRGDISPEGLREKTQYVMELMEGRLAGLGFTWADAAYTQVYTVFDIGQFVADDIIKRGDGAIDFVWHYCRPPVINIDYEMDVHGPARVINL